MADMVLIFGGSLNLRLKRTVKMVEDEKLLTDFCYLPLFDELFEGILSGK